MISGSNVTNLGRFKVERVGIAETFAAFDSLPEPIRAALNAANHKFCPIWIKRVWESDRYGRTPEQFARDMLSYFAKMERNF